MRQHSALILESEKDSRGVQRAAFNVRTVVPYLDYYHRIGDIHIWNLSTYDTQPIETHFLVTFLVNFQRKRVEISTMCECNLKIVKICQKCANFESGSLSEKLLRIEKVAQNRTSC